MPQNRHPTLHGHVGFQPVHRRRRYLSGSSPTRRASGQGLPAWTRRYHWIRDGASDFKNGKGGQFRHLWHGLRRLRRNLGGSRPGAGRIIVVDVNEDKRCGLGRVT